ncbi:MAG: biotin/lipoate A/B protein ligase family protein [Myxococcota bacterium]
MPARRIQLSRTGQAERAAWSLALAHAQLRRSADREAPECLRLFRSEPAIAFGPRDLLTPGLAAAGRAAHRAGYAAVRRLAGGRAAAFHGGTLGLAWSIPGPQARALVRERFEELAELLRGALLSLGVDARIGKVPGEYCPGPFSVNARDERKLAGMGQKVIRGAAHLGAVLVVADAEALRTALAPVYAALNLDWRPATLGSVEEEIGRVGLDEIERALLRAFASRHELHEVPASRTTLDLARELERQHAVAVETTEAPKRPGAAPSGTRAAV